MLKQLEQNLLTFLLKRTNDNQEWQQIGEVAAKEVTAIHRRFKELKINAYIDTKNVVASPTGNFVRYPLVPVGRIADINRVVRDVEYALTRRRGTATKVHLREPMLALETSYPLQTKPLDWSVAKQRLDVLRPFQALLGMDYTLDIPQPAIIDFGNKIVASGLIAGATGAGKTMEVANMICSICYSTAPEDLQIIFLDPKFDEDYEALGNLPHVTLINEAAECMGAIEAVFTELQRRKREPAPSRLLLLIDEYADLLDSCDADLLSKRMAQLTAVGRSKGIHVFLATQKPVTDIVNTVAKGNLTVRVGGRVQTPKESEIVMGVGGVGCENLPGKGSFYAYLGDNELVRIQSYYLDDRMMATAVEEINKRWLDVQPTRIDLDVEVIASESSRDEDEPLLQQVRGAFAYPDVFTDDGEVIDGMRAKVLKLLFGDDTRDVNKPRRTVTRVLEKLEAQGW